MFLLNINKKVVNANSENTGIIKSLGERRIKLYCSKSSALKTGFNIFEIIMLRLSKLLKYFIKIKIGNIIIPEKKYFNILYLN